MKEKSIYIFGWQPPIKRYEEVVEVMETHIAGSAPEHIFKQRRPLESNQKAFVEWREENFRPFLKDYFESVIYKVNEFLYSLDFMEENKVDFIQNHINTFQFISNDFFKLSEQDPNAVIVVQPTIYKQITPSGSPESVVVDIQLNKEIDIEYKWIDSDKIAYLDTDKVIYLAGQWEVIGEKNVQYENYFYELSKEATNILIPKLVGKDIEYVRVNLYINNLKTSPVIPVKNNLIRYDEEIYNVPYLWGSAMIGDLIYGQHSDLQVTSTRHVFPIKTMLRNPCTNIHATMNEVGAHVVCNDNNTCTTCNTCNGVGYIVQESPFGTIYIDSKTGFDQGQPILNPVSYVSPDTSPMTFNKELIDWYVAKLEKTLGFVEQNYTNQSAEAKRLDRKEKEAKVKVILDDILKVYVHLNKVIFEYLNINSQLEYKFVLTNEYDIYSIDELRDQLNDAITNKSPLFLRKNLIKKIFLKEYGKSKKSEFIVDFLIKNDLFFGMTDDEILNKTAILGTIERIDMIRHDIGVNILEDILKDKQSFEEILPTEYDKIKIQFDTILNEY